MIATVRMPAAGQSALTSDPVPEVGGSLESALRSPRHPGIEVGRWTLWRDGTAWCVARRVPGKGDRARWRDEGWHATLPQALRRLLDRHVQDVGADAPDLVELVARVEACYRDLVDVLEASRDAAARG